MKPGLLVACHDAGGAEVVSSWVRRHLEEYGRHAYILDGPAVEIFRRKIPGKEDLLWSRQLPVFDVRAFDLVLTGSSVGSTIERETIRMARDARIQCAVYLDHWKNYDGRFWTGGEDGEYITPDEVWVTDRFAADLARRTVCVPPGHVIIKGNPYQEDVVAEVRRLQVSAPNDGVPPARSARVLFIHEPGREREFLRWTKHGFLNGHVLRERPHPSMGEAERTLAEDLVWADTVVGCESMALAVALRVGRRVISVLPRAEELHIPWDGIERF